MASVFDRKAAWKRLNLVLSKERKNCFGARENTFYTWDTGRSTPTKSSFKKIISRYGLNEDYILYGKNVTDFVEAFPIKELCAQYSHTTKSKKFRIFSSVSLGYYMEICDTYPEAVFSIRSPLQAEVSIPLKNKDVFIVVFNGGDELMVSLFLRLGNIYKPLVACEAVPSTLQKMKKIIVHHKKLCERSYTKNFDESRKEVQQFLQT